MSNEITVYSDINIKKILDQIFSDKTIEYKKLSSFRNRSKKQGCTIIFIEDIKSLNENFFVKSDIVITNDLNIKENNDTPNFFSSPIKIDLLRNSVSHNIFTEKNSFNNLTIIDQRLINSNNNKSCFLTSIEKNILMELMTKKKISRNEIKESVLNIKKNVETNSLDSHLTRIRKKIDKIDKNVKIFSKNEYILISYL